MSSTRSFARLRSAEAGHMRLKVLDAGSGDSPRSCPILIQVIILILVAVETVPTISA